mmetsp:Transcript_7200/g.25360  ORF Transcript_7200/g.25360 Transcript_7200/m.25360 type:complete len:206 (-) Transcript_7200:333-950(-)
MAPLICSWVRSTRHSRTSSTAPLRNCAGSPLSSTAPMSTGVPGSASCGPSFCAPASVPLRYMRLQPPPYVTATWVKALAGSPEVLLCPHGATSRWKKTSHAEAGPGPSGGCSFRKYCPPLPLLNLLTTACAPPPGAGSEPGITHASSVKADAPGNCSPPLPASSMYSLLLPSSARAHPSPVPPASGPPRPSASRVASVALSAVRS